MRIKNQLKISILTILFLISINTNIFSQAKLAQTGLQFLSVSPDARSAALAGAMTTINNYSSALFSNPAVLAEIDYTADIMFSQNNWIADIKHDAFSASFKPWDGQYGVFGLSAMIVDYGIIEGTIVAKNEQGFLETGLIKPNAFSFGLGYSRALSEKFTVGGQVKYVSQYLGPATQNFSEETGLVKINSSEVSVLAFDFGTIFKTGFKSLVFGMSVQNFSKEIKFAEENFQLPLTFNIGISLNLFNLLEKKFESHDLLFTTDAVHPRSHPEQVKMGLEYIYLDMLSIRLGYVSNADENDLSYGVGFKQFGFMVDYAYTPFGVFDNVQRFTLRFSI